MSLQEAQHFSPGSITFLSGSLAGQSFEVAKPEVTIGRESTNDIVVPGDPRVSRNHARLRWENGIWTIENLSQQNVISVNQEPVYRTVLQDNQVITLGQVTKFVFHVQASAEAPVDDERTLTIQPPPAESPAPPAEAALAQPSPAP